MQDSSSNSMDDNNPFRLQSAAVTVATLFRQRVAIDGDRVALVDLDRQLTYRQLETRSNRLANVLIEQGIAAGDRVAMLAKNCAEYVELELACAKIGAIVCALNWRLATPELEHCIRLVSPKVLVHQAEFEQPWQQLGPSIEQVLVIGDDYEQRLTKASDQIVCRELDAEDGLIIIYTSGTTGLPKGALISHRAMIARSMAYLVEMGIDSSQGFIAWPPFYHMASTDQALATLMTGGTVYVVDGYLPDQIMDILEQTAVGWLALMPGMVGQFVEDAKKRPKPLQPVGLQYVGAMADLVPPQEIAAATRLLNAPYANTFGSTETGLPPATSSSFPVGEAPTRRAKRISSLCEIRLVDENDNDVPDGVPGELLFRGPTLFSGYWNAAETNRKDFRGGWFHLGDLFIRQPDGTIDFVDRSKYMIKSGGENIYPAEIERVLLKHDGVQDAAVVKQQDERWGEVPIAYVALHDDTITEEQLLDFCRQQLASYKLPKAIHFINFEQFPRSTAGKIQHHKLERAATS